MTTLLLIWIALLAALLIFAIGSRRDGGVLTLSYFLGLSLIHVPGALAYAVVPSFLNGQEETALGFEMTLVGMGAFVLGAAVVRVLSTQKIPTADQPSSWIYREALAGLSIKMTIAGLLSYFVVLPVSAFVPSLTSLVSPLTALLIIGLWIQLYLGVILNDYRRLCGAFLMTLLLPVLTTVAGGFINFGVYWSLSIISFFFVMSPRRTWMLAVAPVFVYLALSLFVTYMRDRAEIREVVWQEDAGFADRIARVGKTISTFEFLDFTNPQHVYALDDRLNQNFFVGLAIERKEADAFDFEYGGTVPVWALVPRFIWPAKPAVGGGRTVVEDVTGLDLDENSSFGAGQVLEFYVNFGWLGVVLGFLGLGVLFRRLDRAVVRALAEVDVRWLLLSAMPGFFLLQPGGNLLEMLVSVVAALIIAYLLGLKAGLWSPVLAEANVVRS
jgi:hypothetical protein